MHSLLCRWFFVGFFFFAVLNTALQIVCRRNASISHCPPDQRDYMGFQNLIIRGEMHISCLKDISEKTRGTAAWQRAAVDSLRTAEEGWHELQG